MEKPRKYHATAILMMDGRILIAGGGLCNCELNESNYQIFSPPYLFNDDGSLAERPVLLSVPKEANGNSTITITADENSTEFAMLRMSSVTHSLNNEQRRVPITYTNNGNGSYSLNLPNNNILIPGHYMLSSLKDKGVPSVANQF